MKSDTADHSILLVDDNEPGRYATAQAQIEAGRAITTPMTWPRWATASYPSRR